MNEQTKDGVRAAVREPYGNMARSSTGASCAPGCCGPGAGDGTADVILSNCVVNLSPDKAAVSQDAFRVLKPGGRPAISDVVKTQALPALTGCVSGDGSANLHMIVPADRGAFRDLEAKLRPFIARRVRSEVDVDDILQDVFLRMQRGLAGLRDDERFGPWVYQVARSAIVDHVRAAARHRVMDGGREEEPVPTDDDDRAVEQELASYIAPFVATLPSPYREALTLTELQGLTQKEAAAMLGVSISGMKSRVQRGRVQLRRALEECCHIALDARGRVMACEPRADGRSPDGCCD